MHLESNLIPMTSLKAMIFYKNNGENQFSYLNAKGRRRTFCGIISGDPPLLRIKAADRYLVTVEHRLRLIAFREILTEISNIAQLAVVDDNEIERMEKLTEAWRADILSGAPAKLTVSNTLLPQNRQGYYKAKTKKLRLPKVKIKKQFLPPDPTKTRLTPTQIARNLQFRAEHPEKYDTNGYRIPD